MNLETEANEILNEAANHADTMMGLVDQGKTPSQPEYNAHLLKTLTVIAWALLEAMPSRFQPPFRRYR